MAEVWPSAIENIDQACNVTTTRAWRIAAFKRQRRNTSSNLVFTRRRSLL